MNAKILIVEDERDIVDLLQYNLQEAGFETDYVRNGADALHRAVEKISGSHLVRFNASRSRRTHCLSSIEKRSED